MSSPTWWRVPSFSSAGRRNMFRRTTLESSNVFQITNHAFQGGSRTTSSFLLRDPYSSFRHSAGKSRAPLLSNKQEEGETTMKRMTCKILAILEWSTFKSRVPFIQETRQEKLHGISQFRNKYERTMYQCIYIQFVAKLVLSFIRIQTSQGSTILALHANCLEFDSSHWQETVRLVSRNKSSILLHSRTSKQELENTSIIILFTLVVFKSVPWNIYLLPLQINMIKKP